MHILLLNWKDIKNPQAGGAEIVTHKHAAAWIKKGHRVTWFTTAFQSSLSRENIDGIEIIRKGNYLIVHLLAFLFYLSQRKNIDIIIDEIHGFPFFTPLYTKKPIIAFIHEVAGEIWDTMYSFPFNIIGKCIESYGLKLYRNIQFWVDAQSTIQELEMYGIEKSHCIAIPCPIQNKVLSAIPTKERRPTFIFMSRIVKMKGIEEALKAFAYIQKYEKNSQLWVVGRGEESYIKQLENLANKLEITRQVTFYGKVEERKKLNLLRRAHILLHTSIKEGWGLVVVEAASQATPAVVYNVGGLRDVVQKDKTGVIVHKNTPENIAKEVLALLSDRKKYIAFQKNGLKWARSLQWEQVTQESIQLLKKTYEKNKGNLI